jgi:hypothetical protein
MNICATGPLLTFAFALASAVFASAANAVSIRCADRLDKEPYFVTYDVATKDAILETPVGNLIKAKIVSFDDEQLELSLYGVGGPIPIFLFRKTNTMRWPGLPARELGRAPADHACAPAADRTMLSTFYPDKMELDRRTPVDAFSIRCHGSFLDFFITMDRSTKAVVMETEGAGEIFSGDVKSIADHKISFTIGAVGGVLASGVWDEQTQELTGYGDQPTKPRQCAATKARSIMELYERLPK